MKRSFTKITTFTVCATLALCQPLTCFAANNPQSTANPTPPPYDPWSEINAAIEITPPPDTPERESKRLPVVKYWYSAIPSGSTPEDCGIPAKDWNAYTLVGILGNSYRVDLIPGSLSDEITIVSETPATLMEKTLEKQRLLGDDIPLTNQLDELVIALVGDTPLPRTKDNGQQYAGTAQYVSYDGIIHHSRLSESYKVRPGDTLGQIILDCGWMPEGRNLYGKDGYLNQYANEQRIDLSRPLIPGEVIHWESEEFEFIDNLYPDIHISVIPTKLLSGTTCNRPNSGVTEIVGALPFISDIFELIPD